MTDPSNLDNLREKFIRLRNNKLFESLVIFVIIFSALIIGAKTYSMPAATLKFIQWLDIGITLFFLLEIIVRISAEKKISDFFKQGWNIFDFVIVTASLIPLDSTDMALLARLLRIFRVLRLVSMIPELRILLNALIIAIPRMGYVLLLMFIIFYIYAATGSFLFGQINPQLWGNVAIALLTLFRVATFEDWTDVMYETMEVYPLSWIYYLTFIFLTAFLFLNMMIGIVLDVMQQESAAVRLEETKQESQHELDWLKQHTVNIESRLDQIEQLIRKQNR